MERGWASTRLLRRPVVRRRVHDWRAPLVGKLVGRDLESREQAIVTSADSERLDVWRFDRDRGDAGRLFKTRNQAIGLGWLVGHDLRAKAIAVLLRLLGNHAVLLFRRDAERRAREAERSFRHVGPQGHKHHFQRLAGCLLRVYNRWTLPPAGERPGRRPRGPLRPDAHERLSSPVPGPDLRAGEQRACARKRQAPPRTASRWAWSRELGITTLTSGT